MNDIIQYAATHWTEWVFAIGIAILGFGYKITLTKLKAEKQKTDAVAEGVQALLRESIIANYNRYSERGCCPIYAKESLKKVYHAYHGLEGNDVATELYKKVLEMPTDLRDGGNEE